MTNAHETQSENIESGYIIQKKLINGKKIKTQSINVREQHSKYKVLFHNSITASVGNVRSWVRETLGL